MLMHSKLLPVLRTRIRIPRSSSCPWVPEQALAALKECLSVGGDKAYLVSDRACGGSDTLATGYILSKAKEKIEELEGIKFDMLMFGKQAIDGDTAQVGPQVAEDLDIPQVTYAWEVWPTEDGKSVRVKKELEEGFEILEMACPCAVTVTKPDYEPRFPHHQVQDGSQQG